MRIRLSRMSDLDRIMDILNDGRLSLKAIGIDQWQHGYPYRGTIEGDINRSESYVLVNERDFPIAVAAIGFGGKQDYDIIHDGAWLTNSNSVSPQYVVVHRLAVSDESKGRGSASRILQEAQNMASSMGKESVRIDTHPGNYPMRRLLVKIGFTECGIVCASHIKKGVSQRIAYEKVV